MEPTQMRTQIADRGLSQAIVLAILALSLPVRSNGGAPQPHRPFFVLNDDAGWCWFEGPRAIVHQGKLIAGTVANGRRQPDRRGDIEATVYDLGSGERTVFELHDRLQADDHNSPVFLVRPDGRILTVYAKHGPENHFYYRISVPNNPAQWEPTRTFTPSASTRLTYQNLALLRAETNRIYNFFRGLNNTWKPSYACSDDGGQSWRTGNVVIGSPAARPYVRYASDGERTIHLFYTEGHPRDYDNSVYHIFYRAGLLHRSDGSAIAKLTDGLRAPDEGTRIFKGDPDHVAWCVDIALDRRGYPCVVYSVQLGSAGLPPREGGADHRYRYARWNGERWIDQPLAFAGTRLYAGEDDYTGLAALDPGDPDVVYISTNADPGSGAPLISAADGQRHWEVFRGSTADAGRTWSWTPVTANSNVDNLRPVALDVSGTKILLWLRGQYFSYTRYELDLVCSITRPE